MYLFFSHSHCTRQDLSSLSPFRRMTSFSIFVKNIDGGYITTIDDLKAEDSVETLKKKVWEKTMYQPEEQRLLWSGKELTDGHDMAHYNVQRDVMVFLVPPLRLRCLTVSLKQFSCSLSYHSPMIKTRNK